MIQLLILLDRAKALGLSNREIERMLLLSPGSLSAAIEGHIPIEPFRLQELEERIQSLEDMLGEDKRLDDVTIGEELEEEESEE